MAELIREICLKCMSFNGIPSTINSLAAISAEVPGLVNSSLSTERSPLLISSQDHMEQMKHEGLALWRSIYGAHSEKLARKLSDYHPDLMTNILLHNYIPILSQTRSFDNKPLVGRILTSIIAISCLRAQFGAENQLTSHLYGLKHAIEEYQLDTESDTSEWKWLGTDEGCEWILSVIYRIFSPETVWQHKHIYLYNC